MSAGSLKAEARRPSARERLLEAADELFYAEGVHTVGIDRIIEHAGVAKASLYSAFGSKDELVKAYLEGRYTSRRARLTAAIARSDNPRDKVLSIFDSLAEVAESGNYRGCAFYNASAESSDDTGAAAEVCQTSRAYTRELFTSLVRETGVREPETLAGQLVVLYDGSSVGARMEHTAAAARAARAAAAILLDVAIAAV
jgi:AcrR family transcriptional regulator